MQWGCGPCTYPNAANILTYNLVEFQEVRMFDGSGLRVLEREHRSIMARTIRKQVETQRAKNVLFRPTNTYRGKWICVRCGI